MSVSSRRAVALALLSAAVIATPAQAAAPTLSTDFDCYSPGEPIAFSGVGYTPGGVIQPGFVRGGASTPKITPLAPFNADGAGRISGQLRAPALSDRSLLREGVVLIAVDQQRATPAVPVEEQAGAVDFLLTDWDVLVDPWGRGVANPRRFTTIRAYGFIGDEGRTLYAHYIRNGRHLRTVPVGRLRAPCGDLTRRMREFPFRPVPPGTYAVHFDTRRAYSPRTPNVYYFRLRVTRAKAVP